MSDTFDLAEDQTARAIEALSLTPQKRLRFLPSALHAITGYFAPGQLLVVAANTGIGKTTFLRSMTDDMVQAGIKVAYLPLEIEPHEFRISLACLRAHVPVHVALQNTWNDYADGAAMLERVRDRLADLWAESDLLVLPQRILTVDALTEAAKMAHDWGATALVIDHINHAENGSYAEWSRLVRRAKAVAERGNMVTIAAAQINREAMKGGHRLTRYMPAQLHQIQGGGVIEQNATVVLNLYRPVKVPTGKSDPLVGLLKAAMKGEIEPVEVLQPLTMGVAVLKHRTKGANEGKRCQLQLAGDKVQDKPEEY